MKRVAFPFVACVAALALAACAHRLRPMTPPELRLSSNPDVRWETEGPHDLAIILENTGTSVAAVPGPSASYADVAVFLPTGTVPVCRHEPKASGDTPHLVDLAPRERRAIVVRLQSCDLDPGAYRYEASYVIPEASGSRRSGRLGPERGRIFVQRGDAHVKVPASRGAVSPPEDAEAQGVPAPANPDLGLPAPPPLGPSSLACVDDELERRGLNAWGDPAATVYPDGPPTLASDVERQKMVLERHPDIASLCRIPP